MTTRRESPIDPEPFTVLVGIVGIVGGIASVAATYKVYAKGDSPAASRGAALDLIGQTTDELRHLKADVETIQEIVAAAEIHGNRLFRLETAAFLSPGQFSRYEQATNQVYSRLRRLVKITNKLDWVLPRLPDVRVGEAAEYIGESRKRLDRILRDRDLSMEEAIRDLVSVIQAVTDLAANLRSDLHG